MWYNIFCYSHGVCLHGFYLIPFFTFLFNSIIIIMSLYDSYSIHGLCTNGCYFMFHVALAYNVFLPTIIIQTLVQYSMVMRQLYSLVQPPLIFNHRAESCVYCNTIGVFCCLLYCNSCNNEAFFILHMSSLVASRDTPLFYL